VKIFVLASRAVRVKYMGVGILVGAISGLLSAIFLFSLEAVTLIFSENNWLLYFLPLGGWLIGT